MKTLLCLAALVVLTAAYPMVENDPYNQEYDPYIEKHYPSVEMYIPENKNPYYRFPYQRYYPEYLRYRYYNWFGGKATRGDAACDRQTLNPNDVISQKFYDDHICLIKRSAPLDLPAFCRDFRQGPTEYQVMLLNTNDIGRLRTHLQRHRQDFYNDRYLFPPLRPPPSLVHYTTDGMYNFIYCTYSSGKWKGTKKSNRYQQYVPRGKNGDPQGVYKIYHGCRPVVNYPGFRLDGNC